MTFYLVIGIIIVIFILFFLYLYASKKEFSNYKSFELYKIIFQCLIIIVLGGLFTAIWQLSIEDYKLKNQQKELFINKKQEVVIEISDIFNETRGRYFGIIDEINGENNANIIEYITTELKTLLRDEENLIAKKRMFLSVNLKNELFLQNKIFEGILNSEKADWPKYTDFIYFLENRLNTFFTSEVSGDPVRENFQYLYNNATTSKAILLKNFEIWEKYNKNN